MTHASLFSGIGGFDLAAEWMGWDNLFHCEWNPFCQKVLAYHFPNSIPHHDITKTDFTIYRGTIDVLTGGFPCQPYSVAGKQKGTEDERHLWPEMHRAIREIQPRFVVGENVPGLVNWNGGLVFEQVQADLEAQGYEVTPFLLPASGVNAPHQRERIWFIAHSASRSKRSSRKGRSINSERSENNNISQSGRPSTKQYNGCHTVLQHITNSHDQGLEVSRQEPKQQAANEGQRIEYSNLQDWTNWPTKPGICIGDDGISTELDGITFSKWRNESIKSGGNAIVPQVAHQIFKAIELYKKNNYDNQKQRN